MAGVRQPGQHAAFLPFGTGPRMCVAADKNDGETELAVQVLHTAYGMDADDAAAQGRSHLAPAVARFALSAPAMTA